MQNIGIQEEDYNRQSDIENIFSVVDNINDHRFGDITLMVSQQQQQNIIIMRKEKFVKDENECNRNIIEIKQRIQLEHQNLLQMPDFTTKIIENQNNVQEILISAYYEYPEWDLEREIEKRKQNQEFFNQDILLKIIYEILDVMSYLQSKKIIHGDIRPKYISYNNNLQLPFQLCDRLDNPLPPNRVQIKNIRKDQKLYLSPILFKSLILKKRRIKHNPYKSEVFSLGIIILECGILQDIQDIYDKKQKQINIDKILHYIEMFMQRYGQYDLLRECIIWMLDLNGYNRKDPKTIIQLIQQYIQNIEQEQQDIQQEQKQDEQYHENIDQNKYNEEQEKNEIEIDEKNIDTQNLQYEQEQKNNLQQNQFDKIRQERKYNIDEEQYENLQIDDDSEDKEIYNIDNKKQVEKYENLELDNDSENLELYNSGQNENQNVQQQQELQNQQNHQYENTSNQKQQYHQNDDQYKYDYQQQKQEQNNQQNKNQYANTQNKQEDENLQFNQIPLIESQYVQDNQPNIQLNLEIQNGSIDQNQKDKEDKIEWKDDNKQYYKDNNSDIIYKKNEQNNNLEKQQNQLQINNNINKTLQLETHNSREITESNLQQEIKQQQQDQRNNFNDNNLYLYQNLNNNIHQNNQQIIRQRQIQQTPISSQQTSYLNSNRNQYSMNKDLMQFTDNSIVPQQQIQQHNSIQQQIQQQNQIQQQIPQQQNQIQQEQPKQSVTTYRYTIQEQHIPQQIYQQKQQQIKNDFEPIQIQQRFTQQENTNNSISNYNNNISLQSQQIQNRQQIIEKPKRRTIKAKSVYPFNDPRYSTTTITSQREQQNSRNSNQIKREYYVSPERMIQYKQSISRDQQQSRNIENTFDYKIQQQQNEQKNNVRKVYLTRHNDSIFKNIIDNKYDSNIDMNVDSIYNKQNFEEDWKNRYGSNVEIIEQKKNYQVFRLSHTNNSNNESNLQRQQEQNKKYYQIQLNYQQK